MILTIVHIILAIFLTLAIFLQGKGGWLAKRWSGENFRSRRGVEKTLFFITVFLAILFFVTSILIVVST